LEMLGFGRVPRRGWTIRTPGGQALTVEHDPVLHRWRVTPGGYERRELRDAVAAASGRRPDADWIRELEGRILAENETAAP
jgi:hypothetical protein